MPTCSPRRRNLVSELMTVLRQIFTVRESRPQKLPAGWRLLASCYGHLGRIEEATTALQEVLRLYPDLTIESIRASHPSIRPEHVEIYVEGLRKAGLPEG